MSDRRTREKIGKLIDLNVEGADKLLPLLDLSEAVKPEVSDLEKSLVNMLAHLDKGNAAHPILSKQLAAVQGESEVDPIKAITEAARILGKPMANVASIIIKKLVGATAYSMGVKAGLE